MHLQIVQRNNMQSKVSKPLGSLLLVLIVRLCEPPAGQFRKLCRAIKQLFLQRVGESHGRKCVDTRVLCMPWLLACTCTCTYDCACDCVCNSEHVIIMSSALERVCILPNSYSFYAPVRIRQTLEHSHYTYKYRQLYNEVVAPRQSS